MKRERDCLKWKTSAVLMAAAFLGPLWPQDAAAEIRESLTMAAVDSLATPGTLVVFDIDNTLIEPTVTLGSDQWFYWYVAELEAAGRTARRAVDEANDVWNRVQSAISEGRSKWRWVRLR